MPKRSAPVVFVGAATLDAIALVEQFPQPDQRMVAEQLQFAGGGPAATAAVAAARLGVRTAFVGSVGGDPDGERIVRELADEGVEVSAVSRRPDRLSGASVVVVDRARGTRAICNRPAPELSLSDSAAETILAAEWVHVDQAGWGPVHQLLAGLPERERPRLSVDAGNPIPGFDPRDVNLFVPTYGALVERYHLGDPDDPRDPLACALEEGARTVVATRGGDGAVARSRDGERAEVAGFATRVVSTLGAGDVFHGALLAGVVHGYDLANQLDYANAAAAASCGGLDGRSAIPSHRDVLDLLSSRQA